MLTLLLLLVLAALVVRLVYRLGVFLVAGLVALWWWCPLCWERVEDAEEAEA